MSSIEEALPDHLPFTITEVDANRAIVRLARFVDHRRTRAFEEQLEQVVRTHLKTACDARDSETIDSDWLTLIDELSLEAQQAGRQVVVVGLNAALKKSADIVGLTHLVLLTTLDEAWK